MFYIFWYIHRINKIYVGISNLSWVSLVDYWLMSVGVLWMKVGEIMVENATCIWRSHPSPSKSSHNLYDFRNEPHALCSLILWVWVWLWVRVWMWIYTWTLNNIHTQRLSLTNRDVRDQSRWPGPGSGPKKLYFTETGTKRKTLPGPWPGPGPTLESEAIWWS